MTNALPIMILREQMLSSNFGFENMIKNTYWTITKDTPMVGESSLQLDTFLQKEDGPYVRGYTMLRRANKIRNLAGCAHAKKMLGQQEDVPSEWRKFYLLFLGTVWYDSNTKNSIILCLQNNGQWHPNWRWLDGRFNDSDRIVRVHSVLN